VIGIAKGCRARLTIQSFIRRTWCARILNQRKGSATVSVAPVGVPPTESDRFIIHPLVNPFRKLLMFGVCSASPPCGASATGLVAINRGEHERATLSYFVGRVAAGLWPGGLPINLPAQT